MTCTISRAKMGHMAGTDRPRAYRLPRSVWVLWIVIVAAAGVDFFVRHGLVWTLVLIAGSAAASSSSENGATLVDAVIE
jgi:hypothetical protein